MGITAASITSETPLIDVARVTVPDQLSASEHEQIVEWKNSQEINFNYEDGMIVHIYDIPGGPTEAVNDPRLGGWKPGSIHPWCIEKSEYCHHFLQRQSFKHLVRSGSSKRRLTRVTSVYKQTPCPTLFSMEIRSALRSVQEWHSKERPEGNDPWDGRLSGTQTPVAIPQVRPVVVRRYRKVKMNILDQLMPLAKKVGKTNGEKWMGEATRIWLFEGLHARMLYGTPLGDNKGRYKDGWFELTLFFEADVERSHEWWRPLVDADTALPLLWPSGLDRKFLHVRKVIFPIYDGDFDKLVTAADEEGCIPKDGN